MANRATKELEKNVFINCPFDPEYYPLLRPLLFTIVYLGFNPKNDFTSDFYTRRKSEGFSDEDLDMMPIREYINFIKRWLRANAIPV